MTTSCQNKAHVIAIKPTLSDASRKRTVRQDGLSRGLPPRAARLPDADLESLVINRLRAFFTDPSALVAAIDGEPLSGSRNSLLIERGSQIAAEFGTQPPQAIKATLLSLQCRVVVDATHVQINFCRHRLAGLLAGQPFDPVAQDQTSKPNADDAVSLTTPARLRRIGREMRMLVDGSDNENVPDPSLLRLLTRAHDIQDRLCRNTNLTVRDIAREVDNRCS